MKQLIIQGDRISGIPSFYEEINRLFMSEEDWKIGNSLDALNDILYGGQIALIWQHSDQSREALGYETTLHYYEEKLQPGSPFNHTYFTDRLAALKNGTGQTYFDIILEIIAEHKNITLSLL